MDKGALHPVSDFRARGGDSCQPNVGERTCAAALFDRAISIIRSGSGLAPRDR
jgi:hypothetical protein